MWTTLVLAQDDGSWLPDLVGILIEFAMWYVCWTLELYLDLLTPMFVWLIGFIPDGLAWDAGFLVGLFETANLWVPLDYAATLLVSWWTFYLTFAAVRAIIKFIPTVG